MRFSKLSLLFLGAAASCAGAGGTIALERLGLLAGTLGHVPTVARPSADEPIPSPEGPEGAHKVTNATDETVRIVILSTKASPAVAVYPDSDKVGIFTESEADDLMVRRESDVDYWDGEL